MQKLGRSTVKQKLISKQLSSFINFRFFKIKTINLIFILLTACGAPPPTPCVVYLKQNLTSATSTKVCDHHTAGDQVEFFCEEGRSPFPRLASSPNVGIISCGDDGWSEAFCIKCKFLYVFT